MALLAANAAENAALKAERDALAQRVFKLEEELALAVDGGKDARIDGAERN
ncbi:hypothetical protein QA648_33920 (plasmid) [Rhizobium sp. CB3171]|uniref:hypothetical protein n=1 Tax=Rhizobium sp. CB3171 TaxID=3039157 RepID=UPI0024B2124C|nr:hypothetical protein [Rhizobium sp. CB3171]WFU06783.1 hypothetical protein QA648_33920 [Rhizobium sp. CB3171]